MVFYDSVDVWISQLFANEDAHVLKATALIIKSLTLRYVSTVFL